MDVNDERQRVKKVAWRNGVIVVIGSIVLMACFLGNPEQSVSTVGDLVIAIVVPGVGVAFGIWMFRWGNNP